MTTRPLPPFDDDSTQPLTPVRAASDGPAESTAEGSAESRPLRPADRTGIPRGLRILEAIAGLLTAGVAVGGIALLVAVFLAPQLVPGTGLDAADGPGWGRVAAHLSVAVAGETGRAIRRRLSTPVRLAIAIGTIVGVLVLLWFAWWR